MRRRLLIAGAFILAGAIVNVGVAWGCAVWIDVYQGGRTKSLYRAFGSTAVVSVRARDADPYWRPASESAVDARGFPARTLWRGIDSTTWISAPLPLAMTGGRPRALPLRLIWPGFALNMLFYAAVLWLLSGGPFRLRRLIRARPGLCPKCTYPIGESDVCSECGTELPEMRTT